MDVSLKWPTCSIANMAQINKTSSGLSGLFLVDIWFACGPDLGKQERTAPGAVIPRAVCGPDESAESVGCGPQQFRYVGDLFFEMMKLD